MLLNIGFFHEKFKKIWNFSKFSKSKIFWKKLNFRKKFQTSNCSKKFAYWVMTKQKNLQRDFIMKIKFPKKTFCARALPRAARAESHIAVKTQKSCFFGIGGRIFWARARAKNFFRIEKFRKFCIFYILLIFLYHLNSWF